MAFFSGRRHLRSKALVMAAAANNHSQPQVFRFVKMRNPPKSLKIFHLCRKPMQNEVPQFGDIIFAAPRKLGCCSYYQVFIRPKQCSEMPSLGQNKKESSCDNKQLYNWGKKSQRSEPLYWCILEVLFPGVRTSSFPQFPSQRMKQFDKVLFLHHLDGPTILQLTHADSLGIGIGIL